MGEQSFLSRWPVLRQVAGPDRLARGSAVQSDRSRTLSPRIDTADRAVDSICPYCAVGCAQKVYVKDEKVTQIEGDPASPISRGRLCPKGLSEHHTIAADGRLTTPTVDGRPATWDTALDRVASALPSAARAAAAVPARGEA